MDKKKARLRRAISPRSKMRVRNQHRLCVYRTPRHIYAQIISPDGSSTLATASSLEKTIDTKGKGKSAIASEIGKLIAERATRAGISEIAFDRSGFKYHGRIQSLAEAARENGLKF